jgi:hypothetical protein
MLTIKNIEGVVMYSFKQMKPKRVENNVTLIPRLKNKSREIQKWYISNQNEVDFILDKYMKATENILHVKYIVTFDKNSLRSDLLCWMYDGRA